MGLEKELVDVEKGFEVVARHKPFQQLPIILSEADPEGCAACSSKVNPANEYRNGTLYPAYTAAAYKALFALADRYKVNLMAMLSWSFEFEGHEYFEGFRSLSTNGVDKPVLNLFRMLALMHGARVTTASDGEVDLPDLLHNGVRSRPDVDAFATRGEKEASVLAWNYDDNALPGPEAPVSLHISGLPAEVHRVRVYPFRIDDDHSNAYTVWKAMGSPRQPTAAQYAELQRRSGLELLTSPLWAEVKEGTVDLPLTLPRQSISLLQLKW